jgi:hypothetical protein
VFIKSEKVQRVFLKGRLFGYNCNLRVLKFVEGFLRKRYLIPT